MTQKGLIYCKAKQPTNHLKIGIMMSCDSNDADFEIETNSAYKEFNQDELNDLTPDLGLSKRF